MPSMHSPTLAYIALGANLDDRAASLFAAVARISQLQSVRLSRLSDLFETAAVGGPPDSPPFLNAALEIQTTLAPGALLKALLEIERDLGRTRRERWEPRIVDLDLLLYGEQILSGQELIIPHPLMHERRFVLEPLAQIAPNLVHPTLQMSISGLLQSLKEGATAAP